MKKRRKSCLYFSTAKALKRSRMLREKKHKSQADDVSGVAKVLDYTEEGELLLQVDGIQDRKVELNVDGDGILDTMIIQEEEGGEVNSADFNDEVGFNAFSYVMTPSYIPRCLRIIQRDTCRR